MSESEKPEKKGGVTIVSGGLPVGDASGLPVSPAQDIGKLTRMMSATKKLAQTLGDYAGDLAESGQMAARGYGMRQHAEGVAAFVDAYARLSEQFGPEKARQLIGVTPESIALRRRAGTRLLQMEEQRQRNIETVASQAAQKLPEKVSGEPVHPDWTARFFESVKDVSDETMQSLWSSILAGEVERPGQTSLQTLEVLKNLSRTDAMEFERFARLSTADGWVFYPLSLIGGDEKTADRILPLGKKMQLQGFGLIYHEPNLGITPTSAQEALRFSHGGFAFEFASLKSGIFVIWMTRAGKEIARFIPEKFPEIWYIRALAKHMADNNAVLRVISPLPSSTVSAQKIDGLRFSPPGDEANISPTASDDELRAMLENCPQRFVLK